MTGPHRPSLDPSELRRIAEIKAKEKGVKEESSAGETDARRLVYELQVHQIELEMQNEELQRVQSELEESRDRYFDLYDMAPVGYLILSEKGLIVEVNLTASKMLAVTRDTLIHRPLSRFIHADDQGIY
ncbi:PAS domain-containing protein, partial [Myxococcota bacterium]|nr:PAS domain-containing protein [Myxococcota bacterium]MBU1537711.1 PAS domain-containing protein [Myxococcota bacterium]